MLGCTRTVLSLLILTTCGLPAVRAQLTWHERPTSFVPLRKPTQKEIDQRESLKQYALGLLLLREDRMLDAVAALEKAIQLDPRASEVYKTLIPFYVAIDRSKDALTATRKVLDLDPDDYEVWYMYARQLKNQGKTREACRALDRGLAVAALKDHPEIAEPMYLLLGLLRETNEDYVPAADAFLAAAKILDHPEPLLDAAPVTREGLALRAGELYEKVGGMYLKAKQYDRAIAAYRQAQTRYPDGAGRLNFNLALVFERQENLPQALLADEAYLRLLPQGLEAYELKIKLLRALRREGEVLPWLERASQNDRFNVGLRLLLARTYAGARQVAQAEKIYEDLAAKSPTGEVYRGLFRLYMDDARLGPTRALRLLDTTLAHAGDPQPVPNPAAAQADAMIAALRDDTALAKDLVRFAFVNSRFRQGPAGKLEFKTLYLLGALADRGRQLEESEKFYRACLLQRTPKTEALVYSGLLRVLWRQRNYKEVEKICRQGLSQAQATNHSLFHNDLARSLARQGKLDEALVEAQRGLNQAGDGDRFTFRQLKVRILSMAERYDEAEAECRAMLKEPGQPGDTLEIHYLLSSVYSNARKLAKSEEELSLILKMDPNNATVNNDLGYIWADQGKNLSEAEAMIRKAIDLDRQQRKKSGTAESEDNAAFADSLGWVLFRRGQIEEARRELERAITLADGDDPTIYDHLGDVYYRLQQLDRARTAWRQALHLYERDRVRTMDEKYKDLKRKYKLLDSARQP